jgi:hypothetical protein
VDYLLFRDSVEGSDVVLQGAVSEGEETVEREWITFSSGTV